MSSIAFAALTSLSPQNIALISAEIGGTPDSWTASEIGDGNVNMIFRVVGPGGQVLIKQAVPYLRCVGESWPLSLKRNFFECKALEAHAAVAPQYLPRVMAFDEGSAAMVMEFLGEHIILRKGVMRGVRYPKFAEHITDYMAKTLFFTSDLFLSAGAKKAQMQIFCENVDLCKITEDLIFTDPYRVADKNRWTSPGLDAIAQRFANDAELKIAITELKAKFLGSAEALIHGDLHTGSIMVNQAETKVIDPEFAFYGPMGFDVGLLLANFFLAYYSQAGLGCNPVEYEGWLLEQAELIWSKFEQKFSALWDTELHGDYLPARLLTSDTRAQVIGRVRADYVARLFEDSLGFAATEMIRRILGLAHVADMDEIEDPAARASSETRALLAARELMLGRRKYQTITQVLGMIREHRSHNPS
ncbi:MAG TPA: S-methyl-5-thioribose kinase [Polyangiaceae bacterium]|nr:S-methyl-5-thioribose kinase [Polyangiaceae bacterium]